MYFWPERQKFAISAETAQFWGFGIGPATRQPLIRIPAEASHRESLQGASLSPTGFTASQSIFFTVNNSGNNSCRVVEVGQNFKTIL